VSAQAWRWLQVGCSTEVFPTLVDLRMVEFLNEEVIVLLNNHTCDPAYEVETRKLDSLRN
jgi:hypothetical protein